jgi:hypothetical protein
VTATFFCSLSPLLWTQTFFSVVKNKVILKIDVKQSFHDYGPSITMCTTSQALATIKSVFLTEQTRQHDATVHFFPCHDKWGAKYNLIYNIE